jgi:hypothetical protein
MHLILTIIGLSPVLYQDNDNVLLAKISSTHMGYYSNVNLRVENDSPMRINNVNLRIVFLDKDGKEITTLDKKCIIPKYTFLKDYHMQIYGHPVDFKVSINSVSPDYPFVLKTINLNKTNREDSPQKPVSDKQDIKTFQIASNNLGAKVNSWNGLTKIDATLDDPKSTVYNLDKSLVPSVLEGFECRVMADDESGIVYKVVFERYMDEGNSGAEFQRLRKILDTKYQVKFSNVMKINSLPNLTFLDDFVEKHGKDPLFITYEYPENNDIQINLDKDITIHNREFVYPVRVTYSVKALTAMTEERIKQEKKNKLLQEENKRKDLSKEL